MATNFRREIDDTPSFFVCAIEAMFVARFVAAAFWRGCGQIFVAVASCATKIRNKSTCVIRLISTITRNVGQCLT